MGCRISFSRVSLFGVSVLVFLVDKHVDIVEMSFERIYNRKI